VGVDKHLIIFPKTYLSTRNNSSLHPISCTENWKLKAPD
jgi:hypothetical protein